MNNSAIISHLFYHGDVDHESAAVLMRPNGVKLVKIYVNTNFGMYCVSYFSNYMAIGVMIRDDDNAQYPIHVTGLDISGFAGTDLYNLIHHMGSILTNTNN